MTQSLRTMITRRYCSWPGSGSYSSRKLPQCKQHRRQHLKVSITETESRLAALANGLTAATPERPSSPTTMFEQIPYTASQAAAKTPLDDLLAGSEVSIHQTLGKGQGKTLQFQAFLWDRVYHRMDPFCCHKLNRSP